MGKNYGAVDFLDMVGAGKPLGTNFVCIRCEPVELNDEAMVEDEVGEYIPSTHHNHNPRTNFEGEYKCKIRTEVSAIVIPVATNDLFTITGAVLVQVNNNYAVVKISAHEHPDALGDNEHLDRSRNITIPAFLGFGANDHLDVFDSELDVQRSEYSITIGHTDDANNIGNHLVGCSHGESHTCTVEAITDETPADPDAPWKVREKRTPRLNTAQYRAIITANKLVAGPA